MRRWVRILVSAVFMASGWFVAPPAARACCPCEPAPACCPLSAPANHALPAQQPCAAATRQAEPRAWEAVAVGQESEVVSVVLGATGLEAAPTRAQLRVWRI